MSPSVTDKLRLWNMILFTIMVVGGVAGWLLGKDPNQLAVLLGAVTAALGIGEASARTKTVQVTKKEIADNALRSAQAPAGSLP